MMLISLWCLADTVTVLACTAVRASTTWTATSAHARPDTRVPTVSVASTPATPVRASTTDDVPPPIVSHLTSVRVSRGSRAGAAKALWTGATRSRDTVAVSTGARACRTATSTSAYVNPAGKDSTATFPACPAPSSPSAKVGQKW